ncbi:retrovirus-related pol polyprotein from transposon TNT 1-94 [Tanacetum coccineum]
MGPCPLTRITTTTEVTLRKPTTLENDTPKPVVTLVYSRKPINSQTIVPVSKPKRYDGVLSYMSLVKGLKDLSPLAKAPDKQLLPHVTSKIVPSYVFVTAKHHELLHDKPPDLSFLHVFGALCYPTNDSENLGKLQPKADIGIFIGYAPTKKAFRIYNRRTRRIIETIHVDFDELTAMASEHSSLGPALHEMTPATISSRLVPNPPPSTPFVPPSRSDWDLLFQPLFDELLTPPPSVDYPAPEGRCSNSVGVVAPSSLCINQDNHDLDVAHMNNDPYFGIPIPEVPFDQSSSTDSIHTIVHLDHQISEHNRKWTKDHSLENIIDEIDRSVSTRLQLHKQALFCYYDAFLTAVEPKMYKDALTQSC